jgi:hypothetical protein
VARVQVSSIGVAVVKERFFLCVKMLVRQGHPPTSARGKT